VNSNLLFDVNQLSRQLKSDAPNLVLAISEECLIAE